jgi:hypothetical protein
MPVGYNGPGAFSLDFTESTGHIIREGDLAAPTALSGGIFYASGFPLAIAFPAALDLAVGERNEMSVLLLTSTFLTLAFFFVAGSFLFSRAAVGLMRMDSVEGFACLLFLAVGNTVGFVFLGGANAGFEMIVILCCIRVILGPLTPQRLIAVTVLSIFLPMYHFTAGILYVSFLVGIVSLAVLWPRVDPARPRGYPSGRARKNGILLYALSYSVFYITYLTQFSPPSLAQVGSFFSGLAASAPPRSGVLADVIGESSPEFFALNAVSTALLVSVLLVILIWLFRHRAGRRHYVLYVLCLFAPLGWLALGFTLWMGITGFIQRMSAYVIYPTVGIISIGHGIGRLFAPFMLVIVVITGTLTVFIYTQSPYNEGGVAVQDEEALSTWIVENSYEKQTIFTDLRLSGLVISQGHFYTVGISDSGPGVATAPLILKYIFYQVDDDTFWIGIGMVKNESGYAVDLIFVSSRMSMDYPAIRGYDYTFKPADENFMLDYDGIQYLNLIASGGTARIYYLCDSN